MKLTLSAEKLHGRVAARASKSVAHRLLLCAALGSRPVSLSLCGMSEDIAATVRCLTAMGAEIAENGDTLTVTPIWKLPCGELELRCGESGSTLRFLLPVVGALGLRGCFVLEGRLPQRPLAPLDDQLRLHGMELRLEGDRLHFGGRLQSGSFTLPGNVSSQYISGLLFALPLLAADSELFITGALESAGYLALTEQALAEAGVRVQRTDTGYRILGGAQFQLPAALAVEGDWSNAAFWLAAAALQEAPLTVTGLSPSSAQGDRAVLSLLAQFGAEIRWQGGTLTVKGGALRGISFSAAAIPDLVPVLALTACGAAGETRITDAARLRLKESDRLKTTAALIRALGGSAVELPDGLIIAGSSAPRPLAGGAVSAAGDHRIAMAAAVASLLCKAPVELSGAEAVAKSYPDFWKDFAHLGGKEQA